MKNGEIYGFTVEMGTGLMPLDQARKTWNEPVVRPEAMSGSQICIRGASE
jgi:hypothetical protein